MEKELIFSNNLKVKASILIDNGKIKEHKGYDVIELIMSGGSTKPQKFDMKANFELIKLTRYDTDKLAIDANYEIICDELAQKVSISKIYIKLNLIEKLQIDFANRKTWIQKNDNIKWVLGLFFSLATGIFLGWLKFKC